MAGIIKGTELHIELWLMSCRVLKRGMEAAMLDSLVERAKTRNLSGIVGYYYPTAKNGMVKDLYAEMGFRQLPDTIDIGTAWYLDISENCSKKNTFITGTP